MSKERNKAVGAVYLFLIKENKILLMRRNNTGYYDGYYSAPAGHIEERELPTEALIRETKEEIGISIQALDVLLVHTMYRTKHDDTGDRLDMFFITSKWIGEIQNCESHKCDEVVWFELDKLPEKMMHHVKYALMKYQNGINFSELSVSDIDNIDKFISKISPPATLEA